MDKTTEQIKAQAPGFFWTLLSRKRAELIPNADHPAVCERWQQFHDLLLQRNAVMNLTAITEEAESILKHYLDSWLCWQEAAAFAGVMGSMLDFGCGGGFPSLPVLLGLKNPPKAVLVDARAKKLDFVSEAAGILGLKVLTIHAHWNVKDARQHAKQHGKMDLVTARAVGKTDELIEILAPVTGRVLLLSRGPNLQDGEWEQAEHKARKLGLGRCQLVERSLSFGGETIQRRLFLFARE